MPTWIPGERVASYRIEEALKSGGMGTLLIACKEGAAGFERRVVIKVIHAHLATDASFVRMFIDEAKIASRIHHPNVVHVEELAEIEGTYYLVMEYVPGCSVSQLLASLSRRQLRLASDVAIYIAAQLADGLHAAHEARGEDGELLGVVHRDVSPQNVLLSTQGNVKVIDFGVAKARGRSQSTAGAGLRGKIRYMAPEQAYGRAVDRRTDVYALGIVLWEMLTCRRLFDAPNDFALLDRVRLPEHVPPSRFAPGIAAGLDEIVMAALSPRAEDRPATALELRSRLVESLPSALVLGPPQLAALVRVALAHESAAAARSSADAKFERSAAASPPVDATFTATINDATAASPTEGEASAQSAPITGSRPSAILESDLQLVASLTVVHEGLRAFDDEAASMTPAGASIPIASSANAARGRLRRTIAASVGALAVVIAGALGWQHFVAHRRAPAISAAVGGRAPLQQVAMTRPPPTTEHPAQAVDASSAGATNTTLPSAASPPGVEPARHSTRSSATRGPSRPRTRRGTAPATTPSNEIHAPGPFPTALGL